MTEYEEKLEEYMQWYILQYGQQKFLKISKKLLTSNSVRSFLVSNYQIRAVSHIDIITTVMNIAYFGFGKKSTVEMASLMLLQTWNEEINKKLFIIDDYILCGIFDNIIKKCRGLL